MQRMQRPDPSEQAAYYDTYIRLVPAGDIVQTLSRQHDQTPQASLRGLSDAQACWRPAPAEWSVKQVVGHMLDTERAFALRALWFARGGEQALPGFSQTEWMACWPRCTAPGRLAGRMGTPPRKQPAALRRLRRRGVGAGRHCQRQPQHRAHMGLVYRRARAPSSRITPHGVPRGYGLNLPASICYGRDERPS